MINKKADEGVLFYGAVNDLTPVNYSEHSGLPQHERRTAPRVKDHIFVFFRLAGQSGDFRECLTRNISSGGLSVDTVQQLPVDELVYLELYAPGDYNKHVLQSIYITAKVVWNLMLNGDPGSNQYRSGLQYSVISKKDQANLSRYCEEGFVERS